MPVPVLRSLLASSLMLDRGANADDAARDLFAQNGTHWLGMHARLSAGSYNPLVQAGDKALLFSGGTAGTGALVLAPWATSAAGLRITPTLSMSAPTVTVAGSLSSDGAYAALWFQDRSSSNRWAWYAGGGTAWLWNGSANAVDVTTYRLSAYSARIGQWVGGSPYVGVFAGDMVTGSEYMLLAAAAGSTDVNTYVSARTDGAVKIRPSANNVGAETSFETAGVYFRTAQYQLNAAGSAFVRQPRHFVQSSDPGAAAQDGDVWTQT